MKNQNKFNAILIVLVALVIGLGCGGGGGSSQTQFDEANKVVETANKKLDETKELYAKTEERNKTLFAVNVKTLQQLQYYKSRMSGEAKSIVGDYERVSEMLKDISKQYDEVSRMNVGDKYKDYAKLKSDEFAKRSEAVNIRKGNAQAFMEIDDPRTMTSKFDENNSKSDRLFKDADEMGVKSKKMEEENKDLFKQN